MAKDRKPVFGRELKDVCRCNRIPVYRDCISLLTKARDGEQPAYCLEGLFKSQVTGRKVQLLRQAYQLGRNPLRMLSGRQDPYAVAGLLQAWLRELPEPLVCSDLYYEILQSQQSQDKAQCMHNLRNVLKKNDTYRLRVLLPLLELLHHYCINQRSIQHAAVYIGERFAWCLLRPSHHSGAEGESEAPAVSACVAMVLDYRSLFGQNTSDFDTEVAQRSASFAASMPRVSSGTQASKPCPMPSSSMAARRLPPSEPLVLLRSEPEDFEHAKSACCAWPIGSPMSDDMDSAFSASSMETDDNKFDFETEGLDDDLVHAVDDLFLKSTSDLFFTGRASDQSNC
ncbi:hypothetical protein ABBQ32_006850 [Trebouxia sp. C0010 RCD-2024]